MTLFYACALQLLLRATQDSALLTNAALIAFKGQEIPQQILG